jgi:alkylation response protein AidB-like acyl-CoA dehydrogenase
MKYYNRLADVYTPLVKLLSSEFANELAYDSVQIHGGSGYMKDFACERLYRDARVLNIYEGTSQLQVVAAINGVTKGVFMDSIARYEAMEYAESMQAVKERLISLRERVEAMVAHVESVSKESSQFRDFHARRLVESVGYIIITYLLAKQAAYSEEYGSDAKVFLKMAEQYIAGAEAVILSSSAEDVALWSEVQEEF